MSREEVKPCPFCGSPAFVWEWNGGARVDCSNWLAADGREHFVGIGARSRKEAIEIWNTRK